MGLQAFTSSSPKARVLNGLFVLFNVLAWICCCVQFGGKLAHVTVKVMGGTHAYDIYWKYAVAEKNQKFYFSSTDSAWCHMNDFCTKCNEGGKALIGMQVLAFLGLTVALFLSLVRVLGSSIAALEPTRKSLLVEWGLTGLSTFWFFLSVCVWGGTCFHAASNQANVSKVVGTGFGYLIACFFFLLLNLVLGFLIRKDPATHLGSGAAGASSDYQQETGADSTNYNAGASYQYDANAAQNYAQSYNGDVVPPATGDNAL